MTTSVKPAGAGAGSSWTNPGNIVASDDARAAATIGSGATSNPLEATTFGFAIPNGATILGIQIDVERSRMATGTVANTRLDALKAGSATGTAKNDATDWPASNDATASYGGAADLWGGAWSASDINDANFGVQLTMTAGAGATMTLRIDFIQITITYSSSSSLSFPFSSGTKTSRRRSRYQ